MSTPDPSTAPQSLTELKVRIIKRALQDDCYRQSLVQSPEHVLSREAIRADYGFQISSGLRLAAVQESREQLYLILPDTASQMYVPLSAADYPMFKLLSRADSDPQFRAQLLRKPRNTVEKYLQVRLPKGVSLGVLENSDHVQHIVLPAREPHYGQDGIYSDIQALEAKWPKKDPEPVCSYPDIGTDILNECGVCHFDDVADTFAGGDNTIVIFE